MSEEITYYIAEYLSPEENAVWIPLCFTREEMVFVSRYHRPRAVVYSQDFYGYTTKFSSPERARRQMDITKKAQVGAKELHLQEMDLSRGKTRITKKTIVSEAMK